MTERAIQSEILLAVQQEWPTGVVYRRNVGAMLDSRGKMVRFGLPGQADIACIIEGRAIEVEVKAPGKKQTEDQRNWQKAVERAGGVYVLAYSKDEALHKIKQGLA